MSCVLSSSVRLAVVAVGLTAGCTASFQTDRARSSSAPAAVTARDVTHISEQNESTVMNFPTGDRHSSVLQVEQVAPREVRVNTPYTYEIRVKNLTDRSLEDVVLRATQPEGLTLAPAADPATAPRKDEKGWLTYAVGTLAPREVRTFQVTGTPTGGTAIHQTYDVKFEQQMSTKVTVTAPAVAVVKSGPADADICEDIVWNYAVKNTGTGVARNVVLHDQLPEGLATRDGGAQIAVELGDIPGGQTRQATAHLKAAHVGKFASVAMVQSQAGEARSESVGVVVRQPRLEVAVKGPGQEYLGKVARYEVTVANTGDTVARNTAVRLGADGMLPASVTDASGAALGGPNSAPSSNVMLGAIDAGKSRTVIVAFQPRQGGVFRLEATASAQCAPEVARTVETNILAVGALLLEAVDLQDPVKVGETVVYRIKVTNQGTGPDTNVKVHVTIPDGEEFVKAAGATEGTASGNAIHFAAVPSIAPKETVTWDVTVKATKAADVQFKVQATSDTVKVAAEKTETTKLY